MTDEKREAVATFLAETPDLADSLTHAIGVMIGQWRATNRMKSDAIRRGNEAAIGDATAKAAIVWRKVAVLRGLLAVIEPV